MSCLLYTSDAADEGLGVDLGGRRIIKKKKRGEGWREGVGGGARRQSGSERLFCFFFQAEDGIRDLVRSRGLGDVYKRQELCRGPCAPPGIWIAKLISQNLSPSHERCFTLNGTRKMTTIGKLDICFDQ